MKLLLIGGSGIISSEICNLAISKSDNVTIFNRGKRKEEINSDANLIVGDIRKDSIEDISSKLDNDYDVIIDFLSYTPEQLNKSIKICAERCKQYVFISSATVFSIKNEMPLSEHSILGNEYWRYAQEKLKCEELLMSLKLNCEITIVRPYITYGHTRIPFQVAPLEYYTIINRIKHHKPIVLCEGNTRCTLTYSKDFAIGLYGLLLNDKAYRQVFNITGDYQTTWKDVLKCVGKKIGENVEIIEIPLEFFKKNRKLFDFDIDEIIGDKGCNRVFDNSKIKSVVSCFENFKPFINAIDESLKYFDETNHQIINYKWDAEIDRFLYKYLKKNNVQYDFKKISVLQYGEELSLENKKKYIENRFLRNKIILKIKRKLNWRKFFEH